MNRDTLGKEPRHVLLLDTWHDHAGATLSPVNRCGHFLCCSQLKTVHNTNDLIEVATCCSWIEQRQLEFLIRSNDEDSSGSESNSSGILLLRIHHSIHLSYVTLGVSNDWVGELCQVVVSLDVIDPAVVRLHRVTGESNQLDTSVGKLLVESLNSAKLSCANRGEVSRVREEDYQMAKQGGRLGRTTMPVLAQPTGEAHPTPDSVPARKSSIIQGVAGQGGPGQQNVGQPLPNPAMARLL